MNLVASVSYYERSPLQCRGVWCTNPFTSILLRALLWGHLEALDTED